MQVKKHYDFNIEDSLEWIESGVNQIMEIFSLKQEIVALKKFFIDDLLNLKKIVSILSPEKFPLATEEIQKIIIRQKM